MDGFREGLPAAVCLWGLNLQDNGAARRSGLNIDSSWREEEQQRVQEETQPHCKHHERFGSKSVIYDHKHAAADPTPLIRLICR